MHESLYERNIIFMLSYERKIFTTLYYLFEAFYVHLQRCCCYTHNVRNWLLCLLKYVVFRIYGLLIGQYFCNRQSIARHRLWQSYCQYQRDRLPRIHTNAEWMSLNSFYIVVLLPLLISEGMIVIKQRIEWKNI